ncbi:MAG TPA: hypothetical protein VKX49_23325 [Bryobacteraceae bacterium]|jgi:hypothetical protein|nr:hypothetical protein [Bryobacteraceae bacterium]
MPSAPLLLFDPRRTIQLQGFSGHAATTTLHDATETGFQISGIFQAAEDFANVQLFSAYDYFNHLRVKPLPVTDLSGLTLHYDMEILPVNGEEGNVRPDCVRYASVGWDKLTITTGAGDIYEVPLMNHAAVVAGAASNSRSTTATRSLSTNCSSASPHRQGLRLLHGHALVLLLGRGDRLLQPRNAAPQQHQRA